MALKQRCYRGPINSFILVVWEVLPAEAARPKKTSIQGHRSRAGFNTAYAYRIPPPAELGEVVFDVNIHERCEKIESLYNSIKKSYVEDNFQAKDWGILDVFPSMASPPNPVRSAGRLRTRPAGRPPGPTA